MGSPDDDLPDDEKPRRKVWIRPFLLSKFEVTQEQYLAVRRLTNPSYFSATGPGRRDVEGHSTARHPVENVSWFDAILFCNTLSQQRGLSPYYQIVDRGAAQAPDVRIPEATGHGYRLPTEAEWECACRAKTTRRSAFADDPSEVMILPWFGENSEGRTHPVGEKRANDFGLFDMYGNVAEWCWDGYAEYQEDDVGNPQGPTEARKRVVRGGSWRMGLEDFRPAIRGSAAPTARDEGLGFRVAKYD
jgi:formylglycine-generating enzyme required for sulfatase activity